MSGFDLNRRRFEEKSDADSSLITQLNLFSFGSLFVELAVVTPVEWRNFVSVVSEARKSKPGPMSF